MILFYKYFLYINIFYKCISIKATERIVNPIIVCSANFKVLKNKN